MISLFRRVALFGPFIFLSLIIGCTSGNNPKPTPPRPLALLNPVGGNGVILYVGDTVTVRWSVKNIPDSNQVSSVGIRYSLDGGTTFPNTQFIDQSSSVTPPDTTYLWTIDSTQISNSFVVKIYDYSNNVPFDKSAPFIIKRRG